jgi:hypothetical protein
VREDIYFRIMNIVAASGTGFAFPSQTTYFARESSLDPARSRAAAEAVRAWRARGAHYLPEFPADEAAVLRDGLSTEARPACPAATDVRIRAPRAPAVCWSGTPTSSARAIR